jgi:1-deoxy-D-xylulose-5-phosphate synthase
MAVRYPRSAGVGVQLDTEFRSIPIGKGELLREGEDVAIIAIGSMVPPAMKAAQKLSTGGIEAAVVNARFAKPLDRELILEVAGRIRRVVTVEENTLNGGFGCSVADLLQRSDVGGIQVKSIGLPDEFIEHGPQAILRSRYGLDAEGIARQVQAFFPTLNGVRTTTEYQKLSG